jgi:hypothetical protein
VTQCTVPAFRSSGLFGTTALCVTKKHGLISHEVYLLADPTLFVKIGPEVLASMQRMVAKMHPFASVRALARDRPRLKHEGTPIETRCCLSTKRTSPLKSAGASVHSTTGSRGVRISGSNAGYTMFRGSVKSTGYPLHSPVPPSLSHPCVTVCHHISTGL